MTRSHVQRSHLFVTAYNVSSILPADRRTDHKMDIINIHIQAGIDLGTQLEGCTQTDLYMSLNLMRKEHKYHDSYKDLIISKAILTRFI